MLSSDILVFEYFKKKENDWASKKENALSYLKSKSPEEISSEFKNDRAFNQVTSYINSIENTISNNLTDDNLNKITRKIYSENEEPVLELLNKLIEAIKEATPKEDNTNNQKKIAAIALAASIAIAVFLSSDEKLGKPRKIKNSKSQ